MLIYVIGFLSGILSGMAIGGGTLLVPALVLLAGVKQHMAQGIALTVFLPTCVVAVITHFRQGNIDLPKVIRLITGSVIGAFVGANIAIGLDCEQLRRYFGVFLIVMGIYELFCYRK